jgi:two-component system chemotaxis response regulator CheY
MDNDDPVHKAQVNEALARTLLTERNFTEAERLAGAAAQLLQQTNERSLLARAMTTHGTALARLNRIQQAQLTLQSAVEVARVTGDFESAGLAALTIIEELGDRLTPHELGIIFERAADFLATSQQTAILLRLNAAARRVVYIVTALPTTAEQNYLTRGKAWTDFAFFDEIHSYEALLIERALREAKGKVSRAAKLLHLNHQTLIFLLNNRHKDLLPVRNPPVPRRRSIIRATLPEETKQRQPVMILYVEDNELVLHGVKETLEMEEGWSVDACTDGTTALAKLESDEPYDLLLFDNELPGVDGLTLIRRARELPHRQYTPTVMLSASRIEAEARRAGADEFLKKPDDITKITEHVRRLFNIRR